MMNRLCSSSSPVPTFGRTFALHWYWHGFVATGEANRELYLMFPFPSPCICGWSWQWGRKLPPAPVENGPDLFCWGKCCHLAVRVLGGIPSYFSRNGTKISLIFSPISGSLQLISVTQSSQLNCSFSSTPPQTQGESQLLVSSSGGWKALHFVLYNSWEISWTHMGEKESPMRKAKGQHPGTQNTSFLSSLWETWLGYTVHKFD